MPRALLAVLMALVVTGAAQEVWAADLVPPKTSSSISDRPPYDGTGSQLGYWPDKPPTADDLAKRREDSDNWLQDLIKGDEKGEVEATLLLAHVFMQGNDYVHIDRARALDLYEKAANKGDAVGRETMCLAYVLGEGRPVDLNKGMSYCRLLGADTATGLFVGGYDYEHGLSGPKDEKNAVVLYLEAARLGSAEAIDAMGVRALRLSKPEDARNWFRKGVILGSTSAMDHLALMTEAGQGGPADAREAYWLYVNAARRGNSHAAAWIAAQPPTEPLRRSDLTSKDKALITRIYADKTGSHTELLEGKTLVKALSGAFPADALRDGRLGTVTIHCYVNENHVFDTCIIQRETPLGYGYGRLMATVFGGMLTTEDKDLKGLPTANTVYATTMNWLLD